MVRFLHITDKPVTEDEFTYDVPSDDYSLYNPQMKSVYMSICDESGKSNWLKHCEKKYRDGTEYYRTWLENYKQYFEIDFEKHKILVITNGKNITDFFEKYGLVSSKYYDGIEKYNKLIDATNNNISVIYDYLRKYESFDMTEFEIEEIIKKNSLSHKSCENVVVGGKVNVPKKGTSMNFKKYLYACIEVAKRYLISLNNLKRYFYESYEKYYMVDYTKVIDDGFNGVYFTQNIIDDHSDIVGESCEVLKRHCEWLGSDTLILLKWCF